MYNVDYENGKIYSTMRFLKDEAEKIELMTEEEKAKYKVDPRKFNALRKKQIEKVYGEHGK